MTEKGQTQPGKSATRKGPALHASPILIVDDEAQICEVLSEILTGEGYAVRVATSGAQAIDIARRERIGLALLDLVMPGLDGIQVLQELKKIDERLVVIIMTGHGTLETAKEAMRLGAYDFITKPIELEFLIQIIKERPEETSLATRR